MQLPPSQGRFAPELPDSFLLPLTILPGSRALWVFLLLEKACRFLCFYSRKPPYVLSLTVSPRSPVSLRHLCSCREGGLAGQEAGPGFLFVSSLPGAQLLPRRYPLHGLAAASARSRRLCVCEAVGGLPDCLCSSACVSVLGPVRAVFLREFSNLSLGINSPTECVKSFFKVS